MSIEHGLNYDQWIIGCVEKRLRAKWMKTCGANWRMVEIQILRITMCIELRFAFGTQ